MGVWETTWGTVVSALGLPQQQLAGSGYHLKKVASMEEAQRYWSDEGWEGAPPVHMRNDLRYVAVFHT